MSYIDKYSEEEIKNIIKISTSLKDFARKLGYTHSPSGATLNLLKDKIKDYDTSHFGTIKAIKRSENNVFIKNSTASQHTLRNWYIKGQYSEYKCSICGQLPIWNNKEMSLILDHINGINNDDRLENLRWVCPNCNSQLETTGSRNPNRKHFAKKFYCKDCGKEISHDCERCAECEYKNRIIPVENLPVSREELKNLIRTQPFTEIGKKYNVSDNTIRKWCDKFKLPRKKTDITNCSDEDWSKI